MPALLKIEGQGRAADGRRLAMRAVLIQLCALWALFALLGTLKLLSGQDISSDTQRATLSAALLVLVIWGISRNKLWIGILYGVFCFFSFFSAMNISQFSIAGSLGAITNAILSFVALAVIVIWVRHEGKQQS